jgi:transposase
MVEHYDELVRMYVMNTNDTRKLSPAQQETKRRLVVNAINRQGMKKSHAAKTFSVSRGSIDKWLDKYDRKGHAGLVSGKPGRKPKTRLSKRQTNTAKRLIEDKCPDQLKLPFYLWTRQAVVELLAQQFGVKVSVWTVGRYLKAWDFTPQKPLRRAYEQDPKAVTRWLQEQYPAIGARAKWENALIHWGDEMGMRSDHQTGTSYGVRGKTPVIKGTGKRFGCNMISAITNRGQLSFMIFKKSFTAEVFIIFLRRLLKQPYLKGRKVFLIVDSHSVHVSARTKTWLQEHKKQIEMFFLPTYSPELNPDEMVNNDVKANALGRQRPATQKKMIHLARTYLWNTQRRPDVVKNYFQEEHVRYAAA